MGNGRALEPPTGPRWHCTSWATTEPFRGWEAVWRIPVSEPAQMQDPGGMSTRLLLQKAGLVWELAFGARLHSLWRTRTHTAHHTLTAFVACLTFRQSGKYLGLVPSEEGPPAAGYAEATQPAPFSESSTYV